MPNFNKEFVLECDASGNRIGAVLMQENHPITYLSQGKSLALFAYEKEMLAILFAMKKWCQYLLGWQFIIKMDQSLKFFLDQHFRQEPQHPWLKKLTEYDYLIEYKKGTTMSLWMHYCSGKKWKVSGVLLSPLSSLLGSREFKSWSENHYSSKNWRGK